MEASKFIDYYETLEISPNANSGTIERMFRYLAQRTIPTMRTPANVPFDAIMEAYDTLKDPVKRAQYDIEHKNQSSFRWKLAEEASDSKGIERDTTFRKSCCRFFMSNADKTLEIRASAISDLNAC